MTKLHLNKFKMPAFLGSVLAIAVLSGCASKIDTAAEQQQVNNQRNVAPCLVIQWLIELDSFV